jgi:large subunit ribosomal protein L17
MRHKVAGTKLSRPTDHRMALYRNLVTDLLNHEKITTTEAKAKEARGMAEHMITLGKQGTLHTRRQALAFLMDVTVCEKVFSDLAKRYAERRGGYTRITKVAQRLGDGAAMVQLELV